MEASAGGTAPCEPSTSVMFPSQDDTTTATPSDRSNPLKGLSSKGKSDRAPSSPTRKDPIRQRPKVLNTLSKSPKRSFSKPRSKASSLPSSPMSEEPAGLPETDDVAVVNESLATGQVTPSAETATGPGSWIDSREGYELMAVHLWRHFQRGSLFSTANDATGSDVPSGVAIRYGKAQYVVCPANDERLNAFCQSVAVLNCEAAMTLTSSVVSAITTRLAPSTRHVPVTPSQHIQVVDTMSDVAGARKAQNACFVRMENTLVVWADEVGVLRERARDLEDKLMDFVWTSSYYTNANNLMVANLASNTSLPALASPTTTTPTGSTPNSNSASPTSSSFSSISSVTSFAALNRSNLEKAARNHQRSYTKDRAAVSYRSTVTSIDTTYGAARDKGTEDLSDGRSEPPLSLPRTLTRPQNHARHVSFSEFTNEASSPEKESPQAVKVENEKTVSSARPDVLRRSSSLIRQPETAKNATWTSKDAILELSASQPASSRNSFSSADEQQVWEGDKSVSSVTDEEKQDVEYEQRPLSYLAPLQHGFAVGLNILICFLFVSRLFQHSLEDGNWSRMGISCVIIVMFPVILFFCDNCIGIIMQIIGPVNQLHQNSLYFSGKPPIRKLAGDLPHITIQMPVYKESLQGVLMPTIESVKKAITTYELQGGTAGIIVSEDGMLLVDEQEQKIRREFYERNNVGWVARPGHNKDGYLRKGRFKKASNLNFTCHLSMAIEKMMIEERPTTRAALTKFRNSPQDLKATDETQQSADEQDVQERQKRTETAETAEGSVEVDTEPLGPEDWTDGDETELYRRCLEACLPRMHRLAQAKGNVRLGQLILLIDSDTRVPEDCLLDAATEMTQCPDVGVLQHCSGVMLVSDSYFELCIAFFTRLVNFAISFTVSNGDVAPFMGHNAILRWSAMQEASFVDPEDGVRKIWSESHVSEDFDMALRLLMSGYITRWATYSNNGFEEGVSLTCDDELNRWQKYAFGCSELVFHRLWQWIYKGPFTPLFKTFLRSPAAPIHYKFSACSYIFSYYAIGAAFPMTWALYLVEGWEYPVLDPSFLTPFKIWVAVVVVFTLGGNVGQIFARYRANQGSLFSIIKEHVSWMPCMFIFFGGLSYHVATALLSHALGIDMSWGATNKDLADSNFFLEVPLIWKRFWKVMLLCWATIAAVIIMQITSIVPLDWSIQGFFTYWPLLLTALSHMIYPVVLNPALLRFSF